MRPEDEPDRGASLRIGGFVRQIVVAVSLRCAPRARGRRCIERLVVRSDPKLLQAALRLASSNSRQVAIALYRYIARTACPTTSRCSRTGRATGCFVVP